MAIAVPDLIRLADVLATMPGECELRAATSRAYYAAYHHCSQWHSALPVPGSNAGPRGGKHQELINQLRNPDRTIPLQQQKASKVAGIKLDVLRARRIQADYQLLATPPGSEAADQLSQAKALIAAL